MIGVLRDKTNQYGRQVDKKQSSLSIGRLRQNNILGNSAKSSIIPTLGNVSAAVSPVNLLKTRKPPVISAKCWVIYDMNKQCVVHGRREYHKREIASLTKIMTCWVVIQLCKEYGLNPKATTISISDVASDIRGTTANLQTGDILSVEQLLYGLMLPSGNDAAFALAQHFGKLLFQKKYTRADINKIRSFQFDYHPFFAKYFLKEMNLYAQKMELTQTYFDSPHGLQNIENLSTAYDIGKLSAAVMKNDYFRKIVST